MVTDYRYLNFGQLFRKRLRFQASMATFIELYTCADNAVLKDTTLETSFIFEAGGGKSRQMTMVFVLPHLGFTST